MQPETEKLFITLESIVKGLSSGGRGIGSEGDYPFRPFVWDRSHQGDFSFIKLLQFSGLLMRIELNELIEIWQKRFLNPGLYSKSQSQLLLSQTVPKYQSLLDRLRSQPIDFQAYKIQTYNDRPGEAGNDGFRGYDLLGFIVGQTNDGDWVGFSQQLPPADSAGFGKRLPKQDYQMSRSALVLNEQVDPILQNLKSLVVCQFGDTFDMAIEKLLRSARLLEIWQFNVFDLEQGAGESYQYETFEVFVASYLKNPLIYVFGNGSLYRLYIIGKCPNGDLLGASTIAVWT